LPLSIAPLLIIALQSSRTFEATIGDAGEHFYGAFCIVLSFVGLAIRFITIGYVPYGTSGRNTKGQRAETLNITGMYSIVRHPLYLGNFVISLGIALFVQVWWFVLIYVLVFWLYYERIMFAEEEFLRGKFGVLHLEWARGTPAFFPKFRLWRSPAMSFSLRKALNSEYSTIFGIIISFTLLDITRSLLAGNGFELKLIWAISLFVSVVILAVRTLEKRARILRVRRRSAANQTEVAASSMENGKD